MDRDVAGLIGVYAAAVLASLPAAALAEEKKGGAGPLKTYAVESVKNIVYYDGPGQHEFKHRLDLYLPKGLKDYPVLFFVHGGAWMTGDKDQFGAYALFGNAFAKQGIGVVVTNYRLSPAVRHPEHVKDVARAFAWTVKNVARHGGNPDRIFLCGHSAGAHLVALLAADPAYLKAHALTSKAVRAVIPISGPFVLPAGLLPQVFGDDRKAAPEASPIRHARKGLPPFLIVFAENDSLGCGKKPAEAFCKALTAKGIDAATLEVKDHNHITVLIDAGGTAAKTHRRIVEFIHKHTAK